MAERTGFEPAVRVNRTHAFQACSLSLSDTSPKIFYNPIIMILLILISQNEKLIEL